MASLARLALPALLSHPPLLSNSFLPPSRTLFSLSNKLKWAPQAAVGARSQRRVTLWRTMASGAGSDEVVPKLVPVTVAHELVQAGHRYLDVRTVDEFNAGHPVGAANIPYLFKVGSGMTKNPNFVEEVSSVFGKDDEIVIGCLSGKRSLMAATELSSAGFTCITDVSGGYSAWMQNGLPTE